MNILTWILLMGTLVVPDSAFLWTLFGNSGCNCCRCPSTPSFSPHQSFPQFPSSPSPSPQFYSISYPQTPTYAVINYPSSVVTSTSNYRGPPSASPTSQYQLDQVQSSKYSTNQVAYHSELRPVTTNEYGGGGGEVLSQLEEELAAEKYKYKLQKAAEKARKEKKKKQERIRVFKIKPHKSSKMDMGMVEWQDSQVAKYTNEKAVHKFIEATSEVNKEDLEEFIPIEIGSEPDYADEEPAGPPPNVRNRISNDDVLFRLRRFIG